MKPYQGKITKNKFFFRFIYLTETYKKPLTRSRATVGNPLKEVTEIVSRSVTIRNRIQYKVKNKSAYVKTKSNETS